MMKIFLEKLILLCKIRFFSVSGKSFLIFKVVYFIKVYIGDIGRGFSYVRDVKGILLGEIFVTLVFFKLYCIYELYGDFVKMKI